MRVRRYQREGIGVTLLWRTDYGLASESKRDGVWALDHLHSNSTGRKYPKLAAGIVEGFDLLNGASPVYGQNGAEF
jgi:hypothetical protein